MRLRLKFLVSVMLIVVAAAAQAQESARPMEYGQTVEGNLTASAPDALYRFRGQQGDAIVVKMTSNGFEAYLTLIGLDGSEIAWDDGSAYPDSHIGPYVLPQTGNFQVRAVSLNGSGVGSYTLRVDKLAVQALKPGERVEGELNPGTPALYYNFDAKAGDVFTISVTGDGTLDTRLRVRGSDSYDLAYDDDSGGNYNPQIKHFIPLDDGRFIAIVEPYATGLTGNVTVSLEASELASLDDGPQTLSLGDKRPQEVVVFSGRAGERVRLSATLASGVADYLTLTVMQGTQNVASVSGSTLSELAFAFTVPANGRVTVRLECYTNVVLDVSVQRLEG